MKKPDEKIIAHVDPDLSDLIPGYLQNRRNDVKTINEAIKTSNFDKIRTLGHSMRGSGGGYGFMPISKFGEAIEEAAKLKDISKIEKQLDGLSDFLERVTLVYD
ncbi:MAG: Hpt domain-containing protein [Nitrospinae bacterium]|nr:Hpt domain-containing protein [Nitrospinota bacterium]MZH46700.1 Hpt domain-containing protein [Nitrospinota bacterium]